MKIYYKCYICGKFHSASNNEPNFTIKWRNGKEETICDSCFNSVIEAERKKFNSVSH